MVNESGSVAAKVAVGSMYLTLRNILSTAIGALGYALLARMISREEMGVIAGLTFLVSLIQLASDFGLNSSLAKFVSELKGRNEDISAHILSALTFRIPLCIILASILLLFPSNISRLLFKTDTYADTIRLLALDSILLSISPLLNNILWGFGELKVIAIYGTLSTVIRWTSILSFLFGKCGLNSVLYGWIAGDTALLLMLSASSSKLITFKMSLLHDSLKHLPGILMFSWPVYSASIVSFLYTWYDRAIILTLLPLEQLGIYNITYTSFSVLTSIAISLGSALFPYYGMAYGRNDHNTIIYGIKKSSRYTMLVMFPLALGLAATAKPVITLFAGQQYESGWPVLATLAMFGLVYGLSPAFSNLLLIYGKTKTILLLNLTGLAVVRGASLMLTFMLSLHFISKTVKVEVDKKAAAKTLASSAIMAITVTAIQQLLYSKLLLPLYVAIGAVTYAATIRTLKTLNQEDAQLIKEITGEKYSKYISRILGVK